MSDEINVRTPRNPMMAALMPMLTPLLQGSVGDLDRKLDRIVSLLSDMAETQLRIAELLSVMMLPK